MSLNGLFNTQWPLSLDGTTSLDASSISIEGQDVNLAGLVPYTGANQTVDLGSQIIKTAHTATTNPELVNKGQVDSIIANLSVAIQGSFLDKVTIVPQSVLGAVSFTSEVALSSQTASRVLVLDGSQRITSSAVTTTTLGFLDVSSSIQNQLNSKASLAGGNSFTGSQNYADKTASTVAVFDTSTNLVSSAISTTELNHLGGTTSNIQTQLDGKLNLSGSNANQNISIGAFKVQSTATPTLNQDYTTKIYVDNEIIGAGSLYLLKTGGTMTGDIVMGANKVTSTANPATDDTLTRKGYVDGVVTTLPRKSDVRAGIAPNAQPGATMSWFFGTHNNNDTSPYSDLLLLNGWVDSSAGKVNLLSFSKGTSGGIRQFHGTYDSATDFSDYYDCVMTDLNSTNVTLSGTLNMGANNVISTSNPATDDTLTRKGYVDSENNAQDLVIATKADTSYVDSQNNAQDLVIATKADTSYVDSQNNAQDAVISGLSSVVALKADTSYVDSQNNAQDAVISGLSSVVALKADILYVNSENAAQDAVIATKLPLSGGNMTGSINFPIGQEINWGANKYSRILDDFQLRICTDDELTFNLQADSTTTGVVKMRLDSQGVRVIDNFVCDSNIGIGVTPLSKLHILSSGTQQIRLQTSGVDDHYITAAHDLMSLQANLSLTGIPNIGRGSASIVLQTPTAGGYIQFLTSSAVNTAPLERVRITGAGNVGIGTTNPLSSIDVLVSPRTGTHATGCALYATKDGGDISNGIAEFRHGNGTQGIGIGYNGIYAAGSNPNQDLRFTSKGTGSINLLNNTGVVGSLIVSGADGITLNGTGTSVGVLTSRYYLSTRGDNQDDVVGDNVYGPWYGFGQSGIPGFVNKPCLAGFYGCALRSGLGFMVLDGDGKVGIGTTTAVTALHIARSFTANGDYSGMISFENIPTGYFEWQLGPQVIDNQAAFSLRGGSDGFGGLVDMLTVIGGGTGKFGMGTNRPDLNWAGTAIPNAKLTILGGTVGSAGGLARISLGADSQHYSAIEAEHIGSGSTTLSLMTCESAFVNGSNPLVRVFINETGQVGIGTVSNLGTYRLIVNGTSALDGQTDVSVSGNTLYNIKFANLNSHIDDNPGEVYLFTGFQGHVAIGRNTVRNATTANLCLGVAGTEESQIISVKTDNSGYMPMSFSASTYFFGTGNVGVGLPTIGTYQAPLSKFTINASYGGGDSGGFAINAFDGSPYSLRLFPYVQAGGQVAYMFKTYNQGTPYDSLVIGHNGNVGINTTNPTRPLTVATSISTYGLSHTGAGVELSTFIGGAAGGGWIGTVSNHPFNIYTNDSSAQLTVAVGGNVGIGTTTPSTRLHVVGAMTINGGNIVGNGVSFLRWGRTDDVRAGFAPNGQEGDTAGWYFGTYSNNDVTPFADLLCLNSWGDGSGGLVNLIAYNKGGKGIRQYQGTFGSSSAFSTYYDAVQTDGNSPNVSISGRLAVLADKFSVGETAPRTLMTVTGGSNGTVGTWFGNISSWPDSANGCLYSQDANTGPNSDGLFMGYNSGAIAGYITCLAPAVAWLPLFIYTAETYVYYYSALSAYTQAGGWVQVSDEREKEDIHDLKTDHSLERVLALKPKHYRRKFNETSANPVPEKEKERRHVGFIAQEVQQSNPHCVSTWCNNETKEDETEDDGGRLGMSYNDYVVHLVGAVQEQQKQKDEQQKQMEEQQKRIATLEEREVVWVKHAREQEEKMAKMAKDMEKMAGLLAQLLPK